MFGLGFSEIIMILIVLFIFIKPKDLPGISRKSGKIYALIMRQINGVKRTFKEFSDEMDVLSKSEDNKKK